MISKSNTSVVDSIPLFFTYNVDVAFLVPTETGYRKSIMDATAPVRDLLKKAGFHDYSSQVQGEEGKRVLEAAFILEELVNNTSVSLYRPKTKDGDPRLWFYDLKSYCNPNDLLALIATPDKLYVFNMSMPEMEYSIKEGAGHRILSSIGRGYSGFFEELLIRLFAVSCG